MLMGAIEMLQDWGLPGMLLYLLARDGYLGIRARRNGSHAEKMTHQIAELHKWHAKTDDDGVPVWYVRRSLEKAITKLADNIENQTQVIQTLFHQLEVQRLERRVEAGARADAVSRAETDSS